MPRATDFSEARWMRVAIWLVVGTMVYNVVEAIVALWSGAVADSIALVGFGLDSGIETAAAGVLLWRLWVEARGADADCCSACSRTPPSAGGGPTPSPHCRWYRGS